MSLMNGSSRNGDPTVLHTGIKGQSRCRQLESFGHGAFSCPAPEMHSAGWSAHLIRSNPSTKAPTPASEEIENLTRKGEDGLDDWRLISA